MDVSETCRDLMLTVEPEQIVEVPRLCVPILPRINEKDISADASKTAQGTQARGTASHDDGIVLGDLAGNDCSPRESDRGERQQGSKTDHIGENEGRERTGGPKQRKGARPI